MQSFRVIIGPFERKILYKKTGVGSTIINTDLRCEMSDCERTANAAAQIPLKGFIQREVYPDGFVAARNVEPGPDSIGGFDPEP